MKKHFTFVVLLFVICMNVTTFADEIPGIYSSETGGEQIVEETTETVMPIEKTIPAPVDLDRKNVDGSEYLIKTYEVAADFDPKILIENGLVVRFADCSPKQPGHEKDGFLYSHLTTEKKVNENKKTKEAFESVSIETQSKGMEEILKRLPSTKDYDKDGYTGVLTLDTGSIFTEVSGYTTKTWTVSSTQEYPGLMYADPSYVLQTAEKDGQTLPLTDIKWDVTATALAGDTLVPTEYKAIAYYSKKVSSQVPAGYVTTANYKGTVTKTTVDTVCYTLTYIGTPIYIPAPEPEITEEPSGFPWMIIIAAIAALSSIGGGILLFMYLKSQKGVQIFNEIDKEFICLGRQTIKPSRPVIDLNPFKDVIESKSFVFIIDKATTNKLFGRNISVTLDDVTVKHMVKGQDEKYKFNLELGEILDVE